MKMKNHQRICFYTLSVLVMTLLIVLSACVSSPKSLLFKGIFIAGGRVEGLEFKSGHKQGLTDSKGLFYFNEGDTVAFYLGGVKIGDDISDIDAERTFFSPFDLANDTDTSKKKNTIIDISRLLQTLDLDGNYENGIYIAKEVKEAMAGVTLSFNVEGDPTKGDIFGTNPDLVNLLMRAVYALY